ncbi:protein amnionless [Anoplophora glabripennis]|uniref:protein amnionless n=1 Tax=Anoplophora glabripennis TaxID=217634 RepID=UPI0008753C6F|nr:protein amnionless [Anoplophora glabripennis]
MRRGVFALFLLNFVSFGESLVKVWRHDDDISNPQHWVRGKPGQQCEGLDLREASHSFFVVDHLDVKQILLPTYVQIYLPENTRIYLHEYFTEQMDCVRIKNDFDIHSWLDPSSWTLEGAEFNAAVPHLERIPCHHDDVVFPKAWKSSACYVEYFLFEDSDRLKIHSFKFGDRYLTNRGLREIDESSIPIFSDMLDTYLDVDGKTCTDPTGCSCGNSLQDGACLYVDEPQYYECLEPITPIGFCTRMCGASILIKNTNSSEFKANFEIERIRKALGDYSSDTHVSKVQDGPETAIQIIFTEKEFSGSSLDDAKDFYSVLLTDNSFGVVNAALISSGIKLAGGKMARTAVSIVFGCLCGVLLVFGVIFFVNSPQFDRLNVSNRYHFTSRPLSTLFARYDKMDDERLVLQKAESVVSLEKSFDNPMYGSSAPSTSSASAAAGTEERIPKSEIYLENPMYEIKSLMDGAGDENVTEESQLVDLGPSRERRDE